jgi:iron complex transport system ATP-binding protein
MISVRNLSLNLGKVAILHSISAQFTCGQIHVIMGPNGAGKSTLLKALAGIYATRGAVRLEDMPLEQLTLQQRARRIAYLPQFAQPAWNLTALELVALGRLAHGTHNSENQAAALQALSACDAVALAHRAIYSLSGGERARVLFARLIAGDAEYLLLDEPLNHLDPKHQRGLLQLIKAQAQLGKSLILILHDINAAASIADQLFLMKDGVIMAHGCAEKILTPALLSQAYGTDFTYKRQLAHLYS